jgi:ACT domain-containing protein
MTKAQLIKLATEISVVAKSTVNILKIAQEIPKEDAEKIVAGLEKISAGNAEIMEAAKFFDNKINSKK